MQKVPPHNNSQSQSGPSFSLTKLMRITWYIIRHLAKKEKTTRLQIRKFIEEAIWKFGKVYVNACVIALNKLDITENLLGTILAEKMI